MEDSEQDDIAQLREWLDRLNALASSLDVVDDPEPMDLCEKAYTAWHVTFTSTPPSPGTPAAIIVLETVRALMEVMHATTLDYYETPDVRDRLSPCDVLKRLQEALDRVQQLGSEWLSNGLPSADEIKDRDNAVITGMQTMKVAIDKLQAEEEAHEAAEAADPYGAILIHLDPSRSDAPIVEKVSSLTEDEDTRYRQAYERLRQMLDRELLQHIDDENIRFCDQIIALLTDLRDNRISLFDIDAWDEHRRKIRSALISFTTAVETHRAQTINAARTMLGNKTPQFEAVEKLFTDLRKSSFEYGWLDEMRDALQHGDINAFKWGFGASMSAEPTANVYMSREFMLQFTSRPGSKPWLKRRELEGMDSDPSVLDMIKVIQPLMGPLQDQLDKIMYPNVADDVATMRELLSHYPHHQGFHALQNGPGFTRRNLWPPMSFLAPRVLSFVANYQPDEELDDEADAATAS